jgi:hypothetical protein
MQAFVLLFATANSESVASVLTSIKEPLVLVGHIHLKVFSGTGFPLLEARPALSERELCIA